MIPFSTRSSLLIRAGCTQAAIATLTLCSASAHADSGAAIPGRSMAVDVQADNGDSHEVTGTLVLPLGQSMWTQLLAGSTRADLNDGSTTTRMGSATVGLQTGSLQSQLGVAYREDSDALKLTDFTGAVTWFASQCSVGLDLFYRKTEDETEVSLNGRFRNPKAIAITESFGGKGAGLHAGVDVSERLALFATGMRYSYQQPSGHTSALRIQGLALSGVTRDTALLQDTMTVGATVKFKPVWLTLSYLRDHALDSRDLTQTADLAVDIPVGKDWVISPRLGYSQSEAGMDVSYGGVSLQVSW
jgi:hypothetical protein